LRQLALALHITPLFFSHFHYAITPAELQPLRHYFDFHIAFSHYTLILLMPFSFIDFGCH